MTTEIFTVRTRFRAPAAEVYAWHARPGALERLSPPWARPEVIARERGVEDFGRVVMRVPFGPIRRWWVAQHGPAVPGRSFEDDQVIGPFARWSHLHRFEPDGEDACFLEDRVAYALPLGALGRAFGGWFARRELRRMFAYRHAVVRGDLERHRAFARRPRLRVAVTGASGLIGSALVPFLTTGGHEVLRLVRGRPARPGEVAWDPARGVADARAREGLDALVHLAGETAAARWTPERRERIRESRVQGTRALREAIAKLDRPPRVFVGASAIGYYGDAGDRALDEKSAPGGDFLADVCRAWEAEAEPLAARGVRVVRLRIGIVLAAAGGALARMLPAFRAGAGGPMGGGRQWMSWIALDDVIGAIHFALMDEGVAGPVNAVAPEPVRQKEFARTLGRVLRRPAIAPTPAFAVRWLLGEMGETLVLASQRALPRALEAAGFRFRHPDLEKALRFELGR